MQCNKPSKEIFIFHSYALRAFENGVIQLFYTYIGRYYCNCSRDTYDAGDTHNYNIMYSPPLPSHRVQNTLLRAASMRKCQPHQPTIL